ncbi:hypothetical protein WA158_002709 [Blastocystis sp. Blastoise]
MGIPKFYRWLSERYPLINEKVSDTEYLPAVDGLYLDLNSVIHNATHKKDGLAVTKSPEDVAQDLFNYIDHIVITIKPLKTLFLAVDGVAPRAKMNQQRSRRFKSASEKKLQEDTLVSSGIQISGSTFDTNCITPGTEFMDEVDQYFRYLVHAKMTNDHLWQNINIIYSGHDVPGEGEHKIMAYLRDQYSRPDYDPKQRHCIYGLDADLILLSLSLHDPNVILLREVIDFTFSGKKHQFGGVPVEEKQKKNYDSTWDIFHLSVLREYLKIELKPQEPIEWMNEEKLLDDFIFLMIFSGNDFMPQLPSLDINENSVQMFIDLYRCLLKDMGGFLVEDAKPVPTRLRMILHTLGTNEEDVYMHSALKNKGNQTVDKPLDNATYEEMRHNVTPRDLPIIRSQEQIESTLIPLGKNTFKYQYYLNKFNLMPDDGEMLDTICTNYYEGLCWVMQYYYRDIPSWIWYYHYHYAPFASDIMNVMDAEVHFTVGKPFFPFTQQLGCLPPLSASLLPSSYRPLMLDPQSPVHQYYPITFRVDMNGKTNDWEGIAVIPFIDETLLLEAIDQYHCNEKLTEKEQSRNHFGHAVLYTYDINTSYEYKSPLNTNIYVNIHNCHCKEEPFTILSPQKNQEDAYLITDHLLPNTPSIYNLNFTYEREMISLTTMGRKSKKNTLVLTIKSPFSNSKFTKENYEKIAQLLLNHTCWYGYPHKRTATIIGAIVDDVYIEMKKEETNNNKNISCITRPCTPQELSSKTFIIEWYKTNCLTGKSGALGYGGVRIPEIHIILKLSPLVTFKRDVTTGICERIFSTSSILYPIDLVLFDNKNLPTELNECNPVAISELYKQGMEFIYLGSGLCENRPLFGCKGIVNSTNNKLIDATLMVPKKEAPFGKNIVNTLNKEEEQYYDLKTASAMLNLPENVVFTICGKYIIDSQANLGLNFWKDQEQLTLSDYARGYTTTSSSTWRFADKFNEIPTIYALAFKEERPQNGNSRRSPRPMENDQNPPTIYQISEKAMKVIKEYQSQYPDLFVSMIQTNCSTHGDDIFDTNARDQRDALKAYVNSLPIYTHSYIPVNAEILNNNAIDAIQTASSTIYTTNQTASDAYIKVHIQCYPDQIFLSHYDPWVVYPQEKTPNVPCLGQRIVNIRHGDSSYGERATIIGIYEERKEVVVLFDAPFIGNDDFDGRCASCRASTISWLYCILLEPDCAVKPTPKLIERIL